MITSIIIFHLLPDMLKQANHIEKIILRLTIRTIRLFRMKIKIKIHTKARIIISLFFRITWENG